MPHDCILIYYYLDETKCFGSPLELGLPSLYWQILKQNLQVSQSSGICFCVLKIIIDTNFKEKEVSFCHCFCVCRTCVYRCLSEIDMPE